MNCMICDREAGNRGFCSGECYDKYYGITKKESKMRVCDMIEHARKQERAKAEKEFQNERYTIAKKSWEDGCNEGIKRGSKGMLENMIEKLREAEKQFKWKKS